MFGLKLFLALCSVVIDYCLILINYMLWFIDSFGFVFYFNRLQRPLGGGGVSSIFNRLLISAFGFG